MPFDGSAGRVSGEVTAVNLSDIPGQALGDREYDLFHLIGLHDL